MLRELDAVGIPEGEAVVEAACQLGVRLEVLGSTSYRGASTTKLGVAEGESTRAPR